MGGEYLWPEPVMDGLGLFRGEGIQNRGTRVPRVEQTGKGRDKGMWKRCGTGGRGHRQGDRQGVARNRADTREGPAKIGPVQTNKQLRAIKRGASRSGVKTETERGPRLG